MRIRYICRILLECVIIQGHTAVYSCVHTAVCPVQLCVHSSTSTKFSIECIQLSETKFLKLHSRGTGTNAVFSGTKSAPVEGNCALVHCHDTGTTQVQLYIATIMRACLIEHMVQSECSLRYGFDTNWSLCGRPRSTRH
jgi:hypothetical protein